MTAEQYADLKAAEARAEAKKEMAIELKEEMSTFRQQEGAVQIHLVNHILKQSTKAMDNAFTMGKAAQASSSPAASGLLLDHGGGAYEPPLIPHPGLAALMMTSNSPWGVNSFDGSPGKGGGKGGKGKGKPTPERRRAPDGVLYTKSEFENFFFGLTEWDEAA